MELDGDVDVGEFTESELRRQQLQSYIIKVLQPGTDDATKIQHYHRYDMAWDLSLPHDPVPQGRLIIGKEASRRDRPFLLASHMSSLFMSDLIFPSLALPLCHFN